MIFACEDCTENILEGESYLISKNNKYRFHNRCITRICKPEQIVNNEVDKSC